MGRALARMLTGFECRVLYCDRERLNPELERELRIPWEPFEKLLAASDFVVPLLRLTSDTLHLFNRQTLAQMKPLAFLINVARVYLSTKRRLPRPWTQGASEDMRPIHLRWRTARGWTGQVQFRSGCWTTQELFLHHTLARPWPPYASRSNAPRRAAFSKRSEASGLPAQSTRCHKIVRVAVCVEPASIDRDPH